MPSPTKKMRVAVLFGGRSPEHEVSIVSAESVMRALDRDKYEVVPIGITHNGLFVTDPDALRCLKEGNVPAEYCHAPTALAKSVKFSVHDMIKADIAFPVLHGPYGEDGVIQGFLDAAGLPYVGCGVLASAVGMDKITQKRLLQGAGIQTPQFVAVEREEVEEKGSDAACKSVLDRLGLPCFVKPSNMGSSIGITKVKHSDELSPAIAEAMRYDPRVLVERAVLEPREIEVAVLGNGPYEASVPGEIIPSNEFYDYHAKYVSGSSDLVIPARIENSELKQIQETAKKAARLLHVEGLARVDFLTSKITGEIFMSELNTMPGFTSISMYPKLLEASGIPYAQLLDKLIVLGEEAYQRRGRVANGYANVGDWHRR